MAPPTRVAVLAALLLAAGGGAGFAVLHQSAAVLERRLLENDAALARVLGGLKNKRGELRFAAIRSFVEHSDREEAALGLVYAMEVDPAGRMARGELNPRLFASIAPDYQRLVLDGRERVLRQLAAGKVDRSNRIRELTVGRLRFGFDLSRIDRRVDSLRLFGVVVLGGLVLIGALLTALLVRWSNAPLRRLAQQMTAAAAGEGVHRPVEGATGTTLRHVERAFNQIRSTLAEQIDARQHLAPYLGRAVAQKILGETHPLELASEERAVTVLVVGFRGLSTLATGGVGSAEVLRLTNEYLAPVIDGIADHNGTVFRLEAGRLHAVWGFPGPAREPERAAMKAALAVRGAARTEGRRQAAVGGVVLDPCIGIASGRAVGGNLGSARRVTYSVMGGAAELAQLVEQQARPGEILANEAAFDKLRGGVNGTACAPLMVEGMDEAVPLYRLELP